MSNQKLGSLTKWALRRTILRGYLFMGRLYLLPLLLLEWKRPPVKRKNERPVEFVYALRWLGRISPADVLDVGSGTTAWPHVMANCGFRVTALDRIEGYWKNGFFNRHYHIVNDDITCPRLDKRFDFITCISVIEHIPQHQAAIAGMLGLLQPGGHLMLSFPYNEDTYVADAYRQPGARSGQSNPFICQVFSRREIDGWVCDNGAELVDQEYYKVFSGELWRLGEPIDPIEQVERQERHHLSCILIRKV